MLICVVFVKRKGKHENTKTWKVMARIFVCMGGIYICENGTQCHRHKEQQQNRDGIDEIE